MVDLTLVFIVTGFALGLAGLWTARRRAPDLGALRVEQARVLAAVEQLAQQQASLGGSAQAQQQSVAQLLEASRAQQDSVRALEASVAAQRQQAEGVRAAVEASAKGLAEVKQASEAQRAEQTQARAALAKDIAQATQLLQQVGTEATQRAQAAAQAFERLERLEAVLAGTKSRGMAGENLLAEVIKALPADMRDYGVRIGGKQVEFAIPLPNGRWLPVDSKWTSLDTLEQLLACPADERGPLIDQLQREVEGKVDEVAKYLDPTATCMMAVLAVPDAVYDLCAEAHVTAHKRGVVIVAYSMAVPYVLSVVQLVRRFGARTDEAQLSSAVQTALSCLNDMSGELEGRLSRAITSLENSRRDLRGHVGKAQQSLARVQVADVPMAGENGHQEALELA